MTEQQNAAPPWLQNESKQGPLTPFKGEKPPAPAWFESAIAKAPERRMIPVAGCAIEALTWGERGRPGLLLMHGNSAHADWYSFIAPYFADRFRVTSMSWSGMGKSDWRKSYDIEDFAGEALTVAEATGLYEAPQKPIFLAHSFGGLMLRYLSVVYGDRLGAAIILDSRTDMIGRNERNENESDPPERMRGPPVRTRPNNVYPSFEAALARFRLAPPQPCENLFLVDYIARNSLKRAPLPDGSGEGWTWLFDPFLFGQFTNRGGDALSAPPRCPMAMMWGERSMVVPLDRVGAMRQMKGHGPVIAIPDSGHHVMLDQPLALVAALGALLEVWPNP